MAVILIGEVVNNCDSVAGFTSGNISTDDDFVEGTGAIGQKISSTNTEMYTTSLGATAPYDFSSGGTEFGWHFIMWFNTKTPINPTSGISIIAGDGTDRGNWYVTPQTFYKGGFITKVVDSARDFDTITAGWGATSNPGQLTAINNVGGGFTTTTSIMGNFNNCQLDQMTIGLGLRVSGGTGGSPNTFEEVRAADEDTAFYGWWSSSNGAVIGKAKLFIGGAGATSVFDDTASAIIFADELVATEFYEISVEGSGTTCNLTLSNISSANPDNARWDLNVDDNATFGDVNSVWTGSRIINLSSNCNITGTTFIDGHQLYQSGATLEAITVIAATTGFTSYLISDIPELISDSTFEFSEGHAIELTTDSSSAFTFSNNAFVGYGASGSTDAAIYNNSGKDVIINITNGGDSPTYRNGAGATTTIINAFTLTLTNIIDDSEVRIYEAGTITEVGGIESTSGGTFTYAYDYQAGTFVDIVVFQEQYVFNEPSGRISSFELVNSNQTIPINQLFDRNYFNP